MSVKEELPESVAKMLGSAITTQFASLNREGAPVDTPLLVFPSEDLSTINVATGLAYPAKAERARRNPRVGLFIQGGPEEPVVSVAGMAAVRDGDIQANALRYIAEVGGYGSSVTYDWDVARHAVWYWSRMIIEVTPRQILWWDNAAAMDAPPRRWQAPADTRFPASDKAPEARATKAPSWPAVAWQDYIQEFLDRNARGFVTRVDGDGFPLPMPARSVRVVDGVLELDMPRDVPWPAATGAPACFTYEGRLTLIGSLSGSGEETRFAVERMLPILPLVKDGDQVWKPAADTKAALMTRLGEELARRGQAIPVIPAQKPRSTPGGLRRQARAEGRA
ncbi:MAG TPA: pyridoxamine 5'-phosphate oxidase family protein [Novosphingobium sp.]|nr:pyridoxamine 5'-phosphate oxidase family protein [Novosphingobium sp.]